VKFWSSQGHTSSHLCAKMPCHVSSSIKPPQKPSPSIPILPMVMSRARQVTYGPPKYNVQVENGGSSSFSHAKVPPKTIPSILKVQRPSSHIPHTWGLPSIIGLQNPHGGLNEVISPQIHVHRARSYKDK
jgi:hypothetical protein